METSQRDLFAIGLPLCFLAEWLMAFAVNSRDMIPVTRQREAKNRVGSASDFRFGLNSVITFTIRPVLNNRIALLSLDINVKNRRIRSGQI